MIKILFRFSILIPAFICHAQDTLRSTVFASEPTGPHQVSLGVSNNGQLLRTIDEFYFRQENMMAFFSPNKTIVEDQAAFKLTLQYSYLTTHNVEFGLTSGFGLRKNSYLTDVSQIKASQKYFSLLPFVLKTWKIRSLQFALGGGIPIHMPGKFKASYTEHADWMSPNIIAHNTLDGGSAFGISVIGRIQWFVTPRFSVMSTVNFGALYSNFGGDLEVVPDAASYPIYSPTRTRSQTGFTLPAPELSFGLGFHI